MTDNDLVRRLRQHDGFMGHLVEEAADEIERLLSALIQVRGFASVMDENNWRDLRLHIERQCSVIDEQKVGRDD